MNKLQIMESLLRRKRTIKTGKNIGDNYENFLKIFQMENVRLFSTIK